MTKQKKLNKQDQDAHSVFEFGVDFSVRTEAGKYYAVCVEFVRDSCGF